MITTFDVARCAVRAVLIAYLLIGPLQLLRHAFGNLLWPAGGYPAPPLWRYVIPGELYYLVLFFFSDALAREVVGEGGENEPLENVRSLRFMAIGLVGFLLCVSSLRSGLHFSGELIYALISSSFDFKVIWPIGGASANHVWWIELASASAQFALGCVIFFWRRLARLFGRPAV